MGRSPPVGAGTTSRASDARYTTRVTLPAFRHDAQTSRRLGVPLSTVRTVWMFGFQRRLVRRCECEMEFPQTGPLPQTSQVAATMFSRV